MSSSDLKVCLFHFVFMPTLMMVVTNLSRILLTAIFDGAHTDTLRFNLTDFWIIATAVKVFPVPIGPWIIDSCFIFNVSTTALICDEFKLRLINSCLNASSNFEVLLWKLSCLFCNNNGCWSLWAKLRFTKGCQEFWISLHTLSYFFWKKIALFTRRSTLMKLSKKLSSISSHIILIEIESILETILWTAINSALFLNFRQYNTTSSPTLKDRGSSLLLNLTSETQHLLKKNAVAVEPIDNKRIDNPAFSHSLADNDDILSVSWDFSDSRYNSSKPFC